MVKPTPIRLRPFGRRYISLPSLNKNKLSIVTAGKQVMMRVEIISDDLRDIIKAIIRGEPLDSLFEMVDLLSSLDRKYLSRALQEAQISHPFDLERDATKNRMIHRFNVLRDEILIGNDSPDMLHEFSDLMDSLLEQRVLSLTDYKRLKNVIADSNHSGSSD